jgi:hypothetical protein
MGLVVSPRMIFVSAAERKRKEVCIRKLLDNTVSSLCM